MAASSRSGIKRAVMVSVAVNVLFLGKSGSNLATTNRAQASKSNSNPARGKDIETKNALEGHFFQGVLIGPSIVAMGLLIGPKGCHVLRVSPLKSDDEFGIWGERYLIVRTDTDRLS